MTEAVANLDAGTYKEPSKITAGEWLDAWTAGYLGDIRPRTVESYHCQIRNHIQKGTVIVNKQLQKTTGGVYHLVSTKSDRGRTIT